MNLVFHISEDGSEIELKHYHCLFVLQVWVIGEYASSKYDAGCGNLHIIKFHGVSWLNIELPGWRSAWLNVIISHFPILRTAKHL